MNITDVLKKDLCTGCATCISICKQNAINITINKKGVYSPLIDIEKCNNCGICYQICPGHGVDYELLNKTIFKNKPSNKILGNYINCYSSYSTDYNLRFGSSSGGLISQTLIYALESELIDGALVTRMNKKNPFTPEPFIARNKKDILEASKSKYCPVPANIVLNEILEKDEKYAVVGLPCHINGIRKASLINEKLEKNIKINIGVFCGTTKTFHATDFLINKLNLKKSEIKSIHYRGKGWPGKLYVELKNGEIVSIPYKNYYNHEFCSFTPWRCSLCSDHTCELSDISFGDAWMKKFSTDSIGRSIIISRTNFGENLINSMNEKGYIKIEKINSNDVSNSQGNYYLKKERIQSRLNISKILGKKIPKDNNYYYPNQNYKNYIFSSWFYFWLMISAQKRLRFLFKIQPFFINILERNKF